ncbi:MAG: hypothetical protein GY711_09530 [bacterium]|nr:hypothetical protein [bacterium]
MAMARGVAARRGEPVILEVASGEMFARGYAFYLSTSGVWLTTEVPARFVLGTGGGTSPIP